MEFKFLVEVVATRTQGKFATRDEIGEAIQEALDDAAIGSFEGDNGGEYEIEWSVNEIGPHEAVKPPTPPTEAESRDTEYDQ